MALLFSSLLGCSCDRIPSESKLNKVTILASDSTWNGEQLPDYPDQSPKVTLLRITIPPHAKLDWHKHPVINVGYMTKGVLTVTSDKGETKTIRCGERIIELVGQYHYGENTGDQEAEIIVFYAGDKNHPLSESRPN